MRSLRLLGFLLAAPLAAQSYLVDSNLDLLYAVDLNTGAIVTLGSTLNNALDTPADLCWKDDTNELFTIDLSGGEVGTLDPATATFTLRWTTSLSGWQAMAWDHTQKRFFLHNQSDVLYSLDPATGTLTTIGTTTPAAVLITAMEVDARGRLLGIDFSGGAVYEIDKTTAAATLLTGTSLTGMQGFGIDAEGQWYTVSTTTDSLYRLDQATGTYTLIGPNTGTQFCKGFAICGTAMQRGGQACADSSAITRRMTFGGGANLGNIAFLGLDAGANLVPSFVLLGMSSRQLGATPLPLDLSVFGAPGCRLYTSTDAIFGPIVSGQQMGVPIPNLASLTGFSLYAQCAPFDQSQLGLAFTDMVKLTVTL